MAESLQIRRTIETGVNQDHSEWDCKDLVPGGLNTPDHVVEYVKELRDYGWNQLIASSVKSGSYGAAAAFCAQARAECLRLEANAPHRPSAEKHFFNYLKFWLLEARIERLSFTSKFCVMPEPLQVGE